MFSVSCVVGRESTKYETSRVTSRYFTKHVGPLCVCSFIRLMNSFVVVFFLNIRTYVHLSSSFACFVYSVLVLCLMYIFACIVCMCLVRMRACLCMHVFVLSMIVFVFHLRVPRSSFTIEFHRIVFVIVVLVVVFDFKM